MFGLGPIEASVEGKIPHIRVEKSGLKATSTRGGRALRHGGVAGNMSKKVGKGEETGVSPNLHAPPPVNR